MTAFTPPPESWLSTRYPKNSATTSNSQVSKKEVEDNKKNKKIFKVPEANQLDDTCKKYIESSEIQVKSNKSLGTDDHFKSAVCSKNLLKVCEKLMTNKEFLVSNDSVDDDFEAELSLMNEKSRMEFYRSKYGNRRDSQSLPASPKMERKNQAPASYNPYFTITNKQQETRPDSSISFLTNLFGITARNPKEAQANIAHKYEVASSSSASNNMTNITTLNGGDLQKQQQNSAAKSSQMIPQPHPYREMNIFSPTSM